MSAPASEAAALPPGTRGWPDASAACCLRGATSFSPPCRSPPASQEHGTPFAWGSGVLVLLVIEHRAAGADALSGLEACAIAAAWLALAGGYVVAVTLKQQRRLESGPGGAFVRARVRGFAARVYPAWTEE